MLVLDANESLKVRQFGRTDERQTMSLLTPRRIAAGSAIVLAGVLGVSGIAFAQNVADDGVATTPTSTPSTTHTDDPAAHDIGDDHGVDDPATPDVNDDPATHDVNDDHGGDSDGDDDSGNDSGSGADDDSSHGSDD